MTPRTETQDVEDLVATLALDALSSPDGRLSAATEAFAAEVVDTRLRGADGRVLLDDGAPKIWLDARLGPARRRFILAHELAHILLSRFERYSHLSPPLDSGDAKEEALCDTVALAVLMPPQVVANVSYQPSLDLLRETARVLGVPVSAVTQRVAQLRQTNLPLLLARRTAERWVTTRTAGVHPNWGYPHTLLSAEVLDCLRPRETRRVSLVLVGPGPIRRRVEADARMSGDTTMILIRSEARDAVWPAGRT